MKKVFFILIILKLVTTTLTFGQSLWANNKFMYNPAAIGDTSSTKITVLGQIQNGSARYFDNKIKSSGLGFAFEKTTKNNKWGYGIIYNRSHFIRISPELTSWYRDYKIYYMANNFSFALNRKWVLKNNALLSFGGQIDYRSDISNGTNNYANITNTYSLHSAINYETQKFSIGLNLNLMRYTVDIGEDSRKHYTKFMNGNRLGLVFIPFPSLYVGYKFKISENLEYSPSLMIGAFVLNSLPFNDAGILLNNKFTIQKKYIAETGVIMSPYWGLTPYLNLGMEKNRISILGGYKFISSYRSPANAEIMLRYKF
jgi:hypothetical protein